MSKYTSKTANIKRSPAFINEKFSDLTAISELTDKMPEDRRQLLENVKFEKQAIVFNTPQIGDIRLAVTENTPSRITMQGVGSPVPLALVVDLNGKSDDSTDIVTTIDIDIPTMLRPFIGPQLQKAVDSLGNVISQIAF